MTAESSSDLLAAIVAATGTAVAARERARPLATLDRPARTGDGRRFERAVAASPAPRIIAECKRRSPSRGILRAAYDPAGHARAYERAGAAAISVLTEPTFFDGALEHLAAVRAAVDLPVLRKDFIISEYQVHESAAAGADAVLLIVAALDEATLVRLHALTATLGLAALVEVHDRGELDRALAAGARLVGVNSRNLRTLRVDMQVLDALGPRVPEDVVAVAESGISCGDDIRRLSGLGYDAFLVGEHLIRREDPGAALEELRAS